MTADVFEKLSQPITPALGLVAAPTWNEAVQVLFAQLFGEAGGALAADFIYAFVVTLAVIFATVAVSRAAERAREAEEERGGLFGRSNDQRTGR